MGWTHVGQDRARKKAVVNRIQLLEKGFGPRREFNWKRKGCLVV